MIKFGWGILGGILGNFWTESTEAIGIYLSDLDRVLAAVEKGITEVKEIAFFIGRSERLVMEYLRLVKEAEGDARQRESLQRLKGRLKGGEKGQNMPKKKDYTMVWRLA
jgi:hypothetical protein